MEEFNERVEASCRRLVRGYATLLQSGALQTSAAPHQPLLAHTAAAEIVCSCKALLDQIHELKVRCILTAAKESEMQN